MDYFISFCLLIQLAVNIIRETSVLNKNRLRKCTVFWCCGKTRNAGTRNSGIRNNKSGMVKHGSTNPEHYNADQQAWYSKTRVILIIISIFSNANQIEQQFLLQQKDFQIYLNFSYIIYSSFKLLSVTYKHYLCFYILYISYITNASHAFYITSINYLIFCFLQKSALCDAYLPYYAVLQIPPRSLFSACIITPVKFFDTFHLLVSSTFIPYLRVSVTYEIYMYQLTSSQTYKMAIENSQR